MTKIKPRKEPRRKSKQNHLKIDALLAHEKLVLYCKDMSEWSSGWAGFPELDVPLGDALVEEFKSFLIDRINKNRAKATIQIYARYLGCLGGELIRHVHIHEEDRKLSARRLILSLIHEKGGPHWPHARDGFDYAKYESVCAQLFRFMTSTEAHKIR